MKEGGNQVVGAVRAPIAEGEVVAGKYLVGGVLGAGSMGVVVAARHIELGHKVALKFLSDRLSEMPWATERFRRESRALARIQSPYVARVLDTEVMPTGEPYFVMEFLEGCNLLEWLKRRGRLSVVEAAGYMSQVASGLVSAHAAGIVHRDLKPSNLFLTGAGGRDACVKIFDFGISRVSHRVGSETAEEPLTERHVLMGSPSYMSPEQLEGRENVGEQADIWACGVTLYELVTGELPFLGNTPAQVAVAVHSASRPIGLENPCLSVQLSKVINRCLCLDPRDRYDSASDLRSALVPLLAAQWKRTLVETPSPEVVSMALPEVSKPEKVSWISEKLGWLAATALVLCGGFLWLGLRLGGDKLMPPDTETVVSETMGLKQGRSGSEVTQGGSSQSEGSGDREASSQLTPQLQMAPDVEEAGIVVKHAAALPAVPRRTIRKRKAKSRGAHSGASIKAPKQGKAQSFEVSEFGPRN